MAGTDTNPDRDRYSQNQTSDRADEHLNHVSPLPYLSSISLQKEVNKLLGT